MAAKQEPIVLQAPSSKSLSHRALLLASLAKGISQLDKVLVSEDILRTRECLQALGVEIEENSGVLRVKGKGRDFHFSSLVKLLGGESGTTFRLLAGLLCGARGEFLFLPQGRMQDRPMDGLEEAVQSQGIEFVYLEKPKCPPFILKSKGFKSPRLEVSLEQSSQYFSGLILGALLADFPLTLEVSGKKALSWPYVGLTLEVLKHFGGKFKVELKKEGTFTEVDFREVKEIRPGEIRVTIFPQDLQPAFFTVEGDFSNASYLLSFGAVGHKPVWVRNLKADSLQGDKFILEVLKRMGAKVEAKEDGFLVFPSRLKGIEVDLGLCPDLVPTVAVLASLATTPSKISNVAHLRLKESDRLLAMATEIAKVGCRVDLKEDGLEIFPQELELAGKEVEFCTYNDHRVAMSLSLYSLRGLKARFDNPKCVAKSFPDFFQVLAQVL